MTPPDLYAPSLVDELTEETEGPILSMTISLLAHSDPSAPGLGNAKLALLPTKSFIEPPFSINEFSLT